MRLKHQFHLRHGKPLNATAYQDALDVIEAKAQFNASEEKVFILFASQITQV